MEAEGKGAEEPVKEQLARHSNRRKERLSAIRAKLSVEDEPLLQSSLPNSQRYSLSPQHNPLSSSSPFRQHSPREAATRAAFSSAEAEADMGMDTDSGDSKVGLSAMGEHEVRAMRAAAKRGQRDSIYDDLSVTPPMHPVHMLGGGGRGTAAAAERRKYSTDSDAGAESSAEAGGRESRKSAAATAAEDASSHEGGEGQRSGKSDGDNNNGNGSNSGRSSSRRNAESEARTELRTGSEAHKSFDLFDAILSARGTPIAGDNPLVTKRAENNNDRGDNEDDDNSDDQELLTARRRAQLSASAVVLPSPRLRSRRKRSMSRPGSRDGSPLSSPRNRRRSGSAVSSPRSPQKKGGRNSKQKGMADMMPSNPLAAFSLSMDLTKLQKKRNSSGRRRSRSREGPDKDSLAALQARGSSVGRKTGKELLKLKAVGDRRSGSSGDIDKLKRVEANADADAEGETKSEGEGEEDETKAAEDRSAALKSARALSSRLSVLTPRPFSARLKAALYSIKKGLLKGPVFGVSLRELMQSQKKACPYFRVPVIIPYLASVLLDNGGAHTEGIFRVSIGVSDLNGYIKELNEGIYNVHTRSRDPHVPAVLLKHFLRHLASPLLPDWAKCMEVVKDYRAHDNSASIRRRKQESEDALMQVFAPSTVRLLDELWYSLSETNTRVICFVVHFLSSMLDDDSVEQTKMTQDNLALVLSLGFLRDPDPSPTALLTSQPLCQLMVSLVFEYVRAKFPSTDLDAITVQDAPQDAELFLEPRPDGPWPDWFEFFFAAGLPSDVSAGYAAVFQKEEMDILDWEDIWCNSDNNALLKSMGVKAGHAVKCSKLAKRKQKKLARSRK